MSLTRKMLKAMGIEEEKIDQIIDAHTETVDALKAYKEDADKLKTVQKELDDLKAAGDGGYKEKYEKEHAAFEKFKSDTAAEKSKEAKEAAYRALLKENGIADKHIDAITRVTDLSTVEMVDGKIKDADRMAETIKKDWASFIPTTKTEGASTATPPGSAGVQTMTKEQVMAIKDPVQRQKAIAENIGLFRPN